MYQRALTGYKKVLGPEHTLTLDTVNNLGTLYKDQGRLAEAEQMYVRALQGKEKALGGEHTLTLETVEGDLDEVKRHRQFLPHEKQQQQPQPGNYTLATEGVRPKPTPPKLLPGAAFADKHREAEEMYGDHPTKTKVARLGTPKPQKPITQKSPEWQSTLRAGNGKQKESRRNSPPPSGVPATDPSISTSAKRRSEKDLNIGQSLDWQSTLRVGSGKPKQSGRTQPPPPRASATDPLISASAKGKLPSQTVPAVDRQGERVSAEWQRPSRKPSSHRRAELPRIRNVISPDPRHAASEGMPRTVDPGPKPTKAKHGQGNQRAKLAYVDPETECGVDTQDYDSYQPARGLAPRKALDILVTVREKVVQAVSTMLPHDSTKGTYKISYICDWMLPKFMRDQFDPRTKLSDVVTLTGNCKNAQATTCSEYIKSFWPQTGSLLLEAIERLISAPGEMHCKFHSR
jgi:Tetratricopeptide repeat